MTLIFKLSRFSRFTAALTLTVALTTLLATGAQAQTCPATPATPGTPTVCAGNPLNVLSGNKFQREVDMPALPGVLGLELVRYYNSEESLPTSQRGILGRGWRLSYDAELSVDARGNTITLHQADGTRVGYYKSPLQDTSPEDAGTNTVLYTTNTSGQGTLVAKRRGDNLEYILTLPTKTRHSFDAQGRLLQITARTGEFVSLQRDPSGALLRVTDPQGRFLALSHLGKKSAQAGDRFRGVQHIDTPVGRFAYEYGSSALPPSKTNSKADPQHLLANLVRVSLPTHYDAATPAHEATSRGVSSSSITKTYHFEDPHWPTLLTGISIQGQGSDGQLMSQRLVTWAYDRAGRAVLSVKGIYDPKKPGVEQVSLDFAGKKPDGSGVTVLTNSLGQTTRYQYALIQGHSELLEARGPGCATCSASNVRYVYDRLGQRTHEIELAPDASGPDRALRATQTDYDAVNRPIRISTVAYVNGKALAPQLRVRYEYGADPSNIEPTLIERPSVIAGQKHQLRMSYNAQGQVTQVSESGYSPLNDQGQISAAAFTINRTTTYTYQVINGRSVLAAIDGPLKNGAKNSPEDSDITRFAYDARADYLLTLTPPGGNTSTLTYDPAGRIARVQNTQGFNTQFIFDALQLTQTRSSGPGWAQAQIQSFKYDAQGRRTESGSGSTTDADSDQPYRPQTAQAFDVLGRLQWRASALGILTQNQYDTESRLIETGRYNNQMAQVQRYTYDPQGRLSAAWDNTGAGYAVGYNAQGHLAQVTDALGRMSRATAPLQAVAQASTHQYTDDFGRVVASVSPDAGTTTRRFDEADRLIASLDAQGNRAVYQHDVQGRIAQQTITDATTKKDSTTRWQYQGPHLIALEHPTQSEHYAYDARGLRIARTVTLQGAGQAGNSGAITSTTRYQYDEAGVLQSSSLPDGSELVYERNGQGQITALQRSQLHSAWMRRYVSWLLPTQTLVQDLQRDLVGFKSYRLGNGIQAQFQRSREGALARVLYRNTRAPTTQTAANSTLPALLGRSTQDTINLLLGVGSAQATQVPAPAPAPTAPSRTPAANPLPGALGLPADPQALIDTRYLWDVRGNLLLSQDRSGAADPTTASYAYDAKNRLIAATRTQSQGETSSRYFYASNRRVLSQQDITDQSDLRTRTQRSTYQPGTHRLMGSDASNATTFTANGQPNRIGQREYVWDALGQLVQVRQQDTTLARYTYSHRGERIGKTVQGHSTHTTKPGSSAPN
jgi:YD repeat-containing protein